MALYHLDTNILIDFCNQKRSETFILSIASPYTRLCTSLICISEFLSASSSSDKRILQHLITGETLELIGFDSHKQAQLAADIRRKTKLKLPDAIILSSAIQHKAHLLTNDKQLLDKASHYISVSNPFDYE